MRAIHRGSANHQLWNEKGSKGPAGMFDSVRVLCAGVARRSRLQAFSVSLRL